MVLLCLRVFVVSQIFYQIQTFVLMYLPILFTLSILNFLYLLLYHYYFHCLLFLFFVLYFLFHLYFHYYFSSLYRQLLYVYVIISLFNEKSNSFSLELISLSHSMFTKFKNFEIYLYFYYHNFQIRINAENIIRFAITI